MHLIALFVLLGLLAAIGYLFFLLATGGKPAAEQAGTAVAADVAVVEADAGEVTANAIDAAKEIL